MDGEVVGPFCPISTSDSGGLFKDTRTEFGPVSHILLATWTSALRSHRMCSKEYYVITKNRIRHSVTSLRVSRLQDSTRNWGLSQGLPVDQDTVFGYSPERSPSDHAVALSCGGFIITRGKEDHPEVIAAVALDRGRAICMQRWRAFLLVITTDSQIRLYNDTSLECVVSLDNFQVWVYYLGYQHFNTDRNLLSVSDGAFLAVDDLQQLCFIEIIEFDSNMRQV